MKYASILILILLSRVAGAQVPTCGASTTPEFRAVFALAIGLNDNFRRIPPAGEATPEYRELRAKIEDYDANQALPCAETAARILQTLPDAALARSLLELVANRAGRAAEALPESLAGFFAARPDEFTRALSGLPATSRCTIVETLASGWLNLRSSVDPAHATERESTFEGLKRAHACGPAHVQPPPQLPRNRERGRTERGQRQSRPRWA